MVNVRLIVEGGGDTDELRSRCQSAFHSLLDRFCGNHKPRIVAKGSRNEVFEHFKIAIADPSIDLVLMLIDSEDPIKDISEPWAHLKNRPDDKWDQPNGASKDQVLFMTTCMETWIYVGEMKKPPANAEQIHRQEVLNLLENSLTGGYKKGKQSFQLLAKIDTAKLDHLPSFARVRRILTEKLATP